MACSPVWHATVLAQQARSSGSVYTLLPSTALCPSPALQIYKCWPKMSELAVERGLPHLGPKSAEQLQTLFGHVRGWMGGCWLGCGLGRKWAACVV